MGFVVFRRARTDVFCRRHTQTDADKYLAKENRELLLRPGLLVLNQSPDGIHAQGILLFNGLEN